MRVGRGQKALERAKILCPPLMEEEHQVGEPLGKAHIVGDDDAGLAKMVLENLNQIAEASGDDAIVTKG